MHIGHPSSGIPLTLALNNTAAANPQWQAGQVLDARVLQAQADGSLLLQLEGQNKPLQARSPLPLTAGQQVKLLVAVEADRIVLRLLDTPAEETALQQAWRSALPRQQPLVTVLQHIARLAQLPPTTAATGSGTPMTVPTAAATTTAASPPMPELPLPETGLRAQPTTSTPATTTATAAAATAAAPSPEQLKTLAMELLSRLADPQRLTTADGLRQAINQSGLFLEARLARGDTSALQQDFRAGLLRLLGAVQEQMAAPASAAPRSGAASTPALNPGRLLELSQHIEGALARVKVQQLQTLNAQTGPDPAWLLELPLRHGAGQEVMRLRIQRESGSNHGSGAPGWSVRLHFDSAQHGGVDSVVTLLGGKVGVSFWAEQPATAARFQQHLEELRGQLQHAGLEVAHLRSVAGRATLSEEPVPGGLLDLSV
ncbi:flagellar hook-length control protein FliK [Sulfurivermis fontis]|uniref:flagellar hook-length control protein FliK n=1 Tax=Sulfurivermis fontis TaxID=1972068 RepID=UPI000FDC1F56|nr:flagellar hook-length control protein FliK [Sulfurivermis fontis]